MQLLAGLFLAFIWLGALLIFGSMEWMLDWLRSWLTN
jgi:hypothetical protein